MSSQFLMSNYGLTKIDDEHYTAKIILRNRTEHRFLNWWWWGFLVYMVNMNKRHTGECTNLTSVKYNKHKKDKDGSKMYLQGNKLLVQELN